MREKNEMISPIAGMSDLSCDRQVLLNDHLEGDALQELYVYTGAAGRIANKYTYESGAHVEIPEDERSILFTMLTEFKVTCDLTATVFFLIFYCYNKLTHFY